MRNQITYDGWKQSNPQPYQSYQMGYNGSFKDCYKLENGIYFYNHENYNGSGFRYAIIDYTIQVSKENSDIIKQFGGYICEEYGYSNKGDGLPCFDMQKNESEELYLKRMFEYINQIICKL